MARLRPTEVRAVTALLDEPADSAEDLARRVIKTLDSMREARTVYVVVMLDPGTGYSVWGPWDTKREADTAIRTRITASTAGAKGGVFLMRRTEGDDDGEQD